MPKPNPMQWDSLPDVLTIRDTATILHMSIESVRQACVKGNIPAVKIGGTLWRISKNNLRAMLEGGYNNGNQDNNRTAPAGDNQAV